MVSNTEPVRIKLLGIQYLRAIAAFMVVVFHIEPQLQRMGYEGAWPKGLSSGVDLFFVISGVIMWVTTASRSISPWEFWQRRLARIVPIYWLFTAFMVMMLLVAPHLLQTSRLDWHHVAASFLFIPWLHPVYQIMEPLVMPGWTLNYEMLFYFVFGVFLLVPERWRFAGVATVLGLLVLTGWMAGVDERTTILGFYTSSIMLEFLFGMALGPLVSRSELLLRVPTSLALLMLVAGIAVAIFPPFSYLQLQPRAVSRGIPAMIAVAGMLALEARGRVPQLGWLRLIGDASYALYLVHFVALSAFGQGWRKLGLTALPATYELFTITACFGCVILGVLCYRLVEAPLAGSFHPTRWNRALVSWRRPRQSGTSRRP